jgi:hypothetical protein
MKVERNGIGNYSGEYKGFLFSVYRNEIKPHKWDAFIHIMREGKEDIIVDLEIAGRKKDQIDTIKTMIDNQSDYPQLKGELDMKNVSYEDMKADFINQEYSEIVSPFMIKRVQKGNDRYYCTINLDNPKFYLSVTSFVSKALPNPFLSKWRGDLGNEVADKRSQEAADYGTFMHIMIGQFIKDGKINLDLLDDITCEYMIDNDINMILAPQWIDKIHNDILSFAKFCIDKNVKAVATEFPVVSDQWMLGGLIDFVLKMDYNRKRINVIMDFKSGRKGFYESHEVQLKTYKDIWNENFGEIFPVTHVFNWSPKKWRCSPTYNLKNQTDGGLAHDLLMQRALREGWTKDPAPIKRGMGVIEFGQESIKDNVYIIKLSDYVKSKNKKKREKPHMKEIVDPTVKDVVENIKEQLTLDI